MTYRNDIVYLRAFSILLVLFFHLDFKYFSLGYLGVDIFFVISGYLMMAINYEDIKNKNFLFWNFIKKRSFRILPLYFIVIILTLFASILLLSPDHLFKASESAFFSSFGFSNIYFWKQVDYFDFSTKTKPLLHLWSLSIEIQFYLLFAILMKFLYLKKDILNYSFILFILSLLLVFLFYKSYSAVFYLLPFRLFEFFIGIFAFFKFNKKLHLALLFIYFLMIFLSFFFLKSFNLHLNLIAVIFTYLILKKIIDIDFKKNYLRLFTYIGNRSYSIYLIHWPVLILINYYYLNALSVYNKVFAIVIILFISHFSYLLEKYFIRGADSIKYSYKIILFSLFISSITLSLLFINHHQKILTLDIKNQELYASLHEQIEINNSCSVHFGQTISNEAFNKYINKCNQKFNIIFGDSHSQDLFNSLSFNNNHTNFISFAIDDCRLSSLETLNKCKFDEIKKFIKENTNHIQSIIYTQSGSRLLFRDKNLPILENKITLIDNYLSDLSRYSKNIFFFGPQREYNFDMNSYIRLRNINSDKNLIMSENQNLIILDNYLIDKFYNRTIKYISKIKSFQSNNILIKSNKFLYSNGDHWSKYGEIYFGNNFSYDFFLRSLN